MKNKQDHFSQRFLKRSLKRRIDNKENLYDNRPVAHKEDPKEPFSPVPTYTYSTNSNSNTLEYQTILKYYDEVNYTYKRIQDLSGKYQQVVKIPAGRYYTQQATVFGSSLAKDFSYIYYDEHGLYGDQKFKVKQSAIVDHIET